MQNENAWAGLLEDLTALPVENPYRDRWLATARPDQLTPQGDWTTWLVCAGRGWGKTRVGAEDVAHYGITHPGSRIAIVAPTYADARDTCIEGDSGLRSVVHPSLVEAWNRSLGEFVLTNGTRYKLFSADEPDRLRGPQHHRAWADELGAWPFPEAYDQLMFGLRLGDNPQCVVTTTPRPVRLLKTLMAAPTTHIARGSTFDNAANLARAALDQLRSKYEGTRLGRQELFAEVLEDAVGGLWSRTTLESVHTTTVPELTRIVIGVDPSGSDGETGDLQGIVVCGLGADGLLYVLKDGSMRASPEQWGRRVAELFALYKADRVVAERNFGGAMVEAVLRAAAPNLPIKMVTASRGKSVRAEPIAALYEQGRVKHCGHFPELEDQMVQMTTRGFTGGGSPDRVDALVWCISELAIQLTPGWVLLEQAREELAALKGTVEAQPVQYAPGCVEWAEQQARAAELANITPIATPAPAPPIPTPSTFHDTGAANGDLHAWLSKG